MDRNISIVREKHLSKQHIINVLMYCVLLLFTFRAEAQDGKKYIREGNREYEKNKFSESEISYRKAINENKQYPDAVFNIGDALYKQNKFEDAGKQFIENSNLAADKSKKSAGFYNLGNSLLKANKVEESIEAYKNSLKLRPDNKETKYNLAYAQDLLRKQEQQKKQQQQDKNKQDQNKDQDKNKDKDKDQNKDQNKNKNDQNKDQNNKKDQQQKQGISKEDAQRLLNAIANDEKKVQEKVKLEKAEKTRVKSIKNW